MDFTNEAEQSAERIRVAGEEKDGTIKGMASVQS